MYHYNLKKKILCIGLISILISINISIRVSANQIMLISNNALTGINSINKQSPFNIITPDKYQNELKEDAGCIIIRGDFNGDGLTDFIRQEKNE